MLPPAVHTSDETVPTHLYSDQGPPVFAQQPQSTAHLQFSLIVIPPLDFDFLEPRINIVLFSNQLIVKVSRYL